MPVTRSPSRGQTFGVVPGVARQLGVGTESLRNSLKQAEIDSCGRPGTSTADALRITKLERQNRDFPGPDGAAVVLDKLDGK